MTSPSYLALAESGELAERVRRLDGLLSNCTVCPHECRIDRSLELGFCSTGVDPVVASWTAHFGEEPVISGRRGSGTVFLANCNMRCVFCQNHQISQDPEAFREAATIAEALADIFLGLQKQGCHNLNWVSPSHQAPQLVRALEVAARRGLKLPVVYNSNGYDSVEVLSLLDGVVDIYMPDLKYADEENAAECSRVADYPRRARNAITEMFRQVGDGWEIGPEGTLERGLLLRMLVLPNDLAGVRESLQWVAENLSPRVGISLMAQYYPSHLAVTSRRYPLLTRTISAGEWRRAVDGLETFMEGDHHWVQDHRLAPAYYRPDFSDTSEPFTDRRDFDLSEPTPPEDI
ncbi:MAG: radical SAM protein [Thermoanaerobaculales bacterium]|nr:radical SAM protein [Thermoanaerobaculales bacterium]